MNESLFKKYENIKIQHYETLFPPDWSLIEQGICPFCKKKLKIMFSKPFKYCNNINHGFKRFKK